MRIEYENAVYHVMNRARDRQFIFKEDQHFELFIKTLVEAHSKHDLEILAYCVMSNHYHLLVRTPQGNLSQCMRYLNSVFTQRYHRLMRSDGALFRGRYKAILVDTDGYLLQVSRYIHRNPIETETPLVCNLSDYVWSSYRYYVDLASKPSWLNATFVLSSLGSQTHAMNAYMEYVARNKTEFDKKYEKAFEKKSLPTLIGSTKFCAEMLAKFDCQSEDVIVKLFDHNPSLPTLVNCVSKIFNCSVDSIISPSKEGARMNMPRLLAMYLGQCLCHFKLSELADFFGLAHYSSVYQSIKRLQDIMKPEKLSDYTEKCKKLISEIKI